MKVHKRSLLVTPDICLIILPRLAEEVGRNEAVFLQQLHYWLSSDNSSGIIYEDEKWIYNTLEEWRKQLKIFSLSTIRRIIRKLEQLRIIKSKRLGKKQSDRTKWYTINYSFLSGIIPLSSVKLQAFKMNSPYVQNEQIIHMETKNTTEIIKRNTSYFQKNNLLSNQSGLGNLSNEQKPMGVEIDLSCRKGNILDQVPTLETEQSIQEGKAVGTLPNPSLKKEDVAAPKESKATKKATKTKPAKVIKTEINRNLELTPERRQIALNARFLNRGLVEGVIETEFESFVDYFTEKGTLRSDWDLSWKNWCKKAIELDKFNRKTIENPIRSGMNVSASTEEKVSIDSAFAGFVKEKLNGMQFDFEGATYAEVDDKIVIDQQNSFRRDQIEKLKDKLQKHFGKEIELKWLRNSWVIPTVSSQEVEIVRPVVSEIVTSDVSIHSTVPLPLCVEEIPLETPPVLKASALRQEPSDKSGIDKALNRFFKAIQERSGTMNEFKNDSENNLSEEKNNSSLTKEKNDLKTVENVSDEKQFYQSEQTPESKPVITSSSFSADLSVEQPHSNEDLQENRSEISITQLCLEFPDAISAKPVEEEIQNRLKAREDVNNLPSPRTSNTTSAISNAPIKLSKPKSALHFPKFPVTAAKSFADSYSTAKSLSDCAEMIRADLIKARLGKAIPLGLFKPPQKSPFKPPCDIISLPK